MKKLLNCIKHKVGNNTNIISENISGLEAIQNIMQSIIKA